MTNLPSQPVYTFGLNKASTEEQIRAYFMKVQELYNSKEEFPINLDDVWPLVYSAKNKAVRSLKENFVENEDYVTVTQNGQGGKFATNIYHLSVSCMEYLIAKKVRTVFNVYREVFKKVATEEVKVVPRSSAEMLLMYAQQMVEQERKVKQIEASQEELDRRLSDVEARTSTSVPYTTIVGFANRFGIRVPIEQASVLGRVSVNQCRQLGYEMGKVQDPRFGWVNTYPDEVLRQTFMRYYPSIDFSNN